MGWIRKNKYKILFLVGLVLMTYINVWGAEFMADDVFGIVDNPKLGDLKSVFANPVMFLRPLYYWLVFNLFGKIPWVFRFLNVFSHVLMSIFVFYLIELIVSSGVGLMTGVLVAVHPIMIESVTWVSGGGYSNYSLMIIISLVLYILSKKENKYYLWSIISFLIALMFSEKAVSFAAIFFLYEWLWGNLKENWGKIMPFFGLSLIWIVIYLGGFTERVESLTTNFSSVGAGEIGNSFIQIPIAVSKYLGLILWPNKLTLYHSEMFFSKFEYIVRSFIFGSWIFGIIISLYKGLRGSKTAKKICFFMSWLIISLVVTLMPLGVAWIVAERYVYLGAVGVFVLIAMLFNRLSKKQGWYDGVIIGFGLLVMLLMVRTLVRNSNWQTADKLWLSATRTSPNSPQNNNNLGDYYGRMRNFKKAEWHFLKAIELNPNYADAMHNLANTYLQVGEFDKAKKYYQKALENRPNLWQSKEQLKRLEEYLEKSM